MPIKVLHVYKTFYPETIGGVEKYIDSLAHATKSSGVIHRVLCTTTSDKVIREHYNGIEVIRYPQNFNYASCPVSFILFMNFYKECAWCDVVHYHYPWPFAALLSLLSSAKKQVMTYHSDIIKQKVLKLLLYPLDQMFLYMMDNIIGTSPQYIETSPNLRRFRSKTTMIPIGLNPDDYPKAVDKKCAELKAKFGDRFLLFIGQLRYYKGLHLLIEAMQDVGCNLVILGSGDAPSTKHKNIFFLGEASEKEKVNYLRSCFAVILPSHLRSEAFGISLLEGAMYGKPLISCKIGTGTEFVNEDGVTGFVLEPNAREIREATLKLLNDEKLAQKMGKHSQERFSKLFHSNVVGKEIVQLYKSLV